MITHTKSESFSEREWMIDASAVGDLPEGVLCFCPIERDERGDITSIVTGLNFVSDKPPNGEKCIGAFHHDGQEAADAWIAANRETIERVCGRGE